MEAYVVFDCNYQFVKVYFDELEARGDAEDIPGAFVIYYPNYEKGLDHGSSYHV